jgi:membrane associated rhomboid family serine protease
MLYLWVFGDNVEDVLGHLGYLVFYLACGICAGLAQIAINPHSTLPSVGASGAIAGVLGGYLVLFPSASVRTLLILGPFITVQRVSAVLLIGFWFVMQLISGLGQVGIRDETGGVAFWAHIGGFVVGALIALVIRPRVRAADPLRSW